MQVFYLHTANVTLLPLELVLIARGLKSKGEATHLISGE